MSRAPDELLRAMRAQGFLIQDLLAVSAGERPMCVSGVPAGDNAEILLARYQDATGVHLRPGKGNLAHIGKDAAALEAFEDATRRKAASTDSAEIQEQSRVMGQLLGYPPCCVEAFTESERVTMERGDGKPWSFPRAALKNSKKGPHSFLLNFLYNFHSRSSGPRGELGLLLRGGYRSMDAHVLPWIPCSLDCEPSLAAARRLWKLLLACDPDFSARLESALRVVVVLVDDWSFVPLRGAKAAGAGYRYDGADDLKTLIDPAITARLARGGKLTGKAVPGAALFDFTGL